MDRLARHDVDRFLGEVAGPCVSLYMPTHVSGEDGQQDVIRLKNLLTEAESQLSRGWMRASEARDFLISIQHLAEDPGFWDARSDGLAVLKSREGQDVFRLPTRFTPWISVGSRFHIRPLLSAVNGENLFFVLTLSQNRAELFMADSHAIERVPVPGLPHDLTTALNVDSDDRGSQVHAAGRVGPGASGKQSVVFHGQGGKPDSNKDDLLAYCRMVDQAVSARLHDEHAPLLLACVDYVAPMYRSVNHYPHLLAESLTGNADYHSEHQLLQRAWPLVKQSLEARRASVLTRYRELQGSNRVTDEITTIVRAAKQGQVDLLILDRSAVLWGQVSPDGTQVDVHSDEQPDDVELLEVAAVATLQNRGAVLEVSATEMPAASPAAAILRYVTR